MRVKSGHIIFNKKVEYSDLLPIYGDLYTKFLEETNQVPEEPETMNMLIKENILDLEMNRKPEGYNRHGRMRMIFPILEGGVEFYVYGSIKNSDVGRVTECLSRLLHKKGLEHEVTWDQLLVHQQKK